MEEPILLAPAPRLVTLVGRGGVAINANYKKLFLCSGFFRCLLQRMERLESDQPLPVMTMLELDELKAIVQFVRKGRVRIRPERLPLLQKAACQLEVSALVELIQRHESEKPDAVGAERTTGQVRKDTSDLELSPASVCTDRREASDHAKKQQHSIFHLNEEMEVGRTTGSPLWDASVEVEKADASDPLREPSLSIQPIDPVASDAGTSRTALDSCGPPDCACDQLDDHCDQPDDGCEADVQGSDTELQLSPFSVCDDWVDSVDWTEEEEAEEAAELESDNDEEDETYEPDASDWNSASDGDEADHAAKQRGKEQSPEEVEGDESGVKNGETAIRSGIPIDRAATERHSRASLEKMKLVWRRKSAQDEEVAMAKASPTARERARVEGALRSRHCPSCSYSCSSYTCARSHYLSVHLGVRYPCWLCGRTYSQDCNRMTHLTQQHGLPSNGLCSKPAEQKLVLRKNKHQTYAMEEKALAKEAPTAADRQRVLNAFNRCLCPRCGAKLESARAARVHLLVEHLHLRYACCFCEEVLRTPDLRRQHQKSVHAMRWLRDSSRRRIKYGRDRRK